MTFRLPKGPVTLKRFLAADLAPTPEPAREGRAVRETEGTTVWALLMPSQKE